MPTILPGQENEFFGSLSSNQITPGKEASVFSSADQFNDGSNKFKSSDDVLSYLKQHAGHDAASRDILFNYLLSEKSASDARAWESNQNSTRYQQMVADLKKAGINPYWLNSLGGAATYQGSQNKYSGSAYEASYRDRNVNQRQMSQNAKDIGSIVTAVTSAIMLAVALL